MRSYMFFSVYLQRQLMRGDLTMPQLAEGLNYRTLIPLERWLRGEAPPPSFLLPRLAEVLGVDPVELSVGWLISKCPDLEHVLQERVLHPMGLDFPTWPEGYPTRDSVPPSPDRPVPRA